MGWMDRARWRLRLLRIALTAAPVRGGSPEGDPPGDPPQDPPPDPARREEDPPEDPPKEIDWKAEARKHEGRSKKAQKEIDDLKERLKKREDEDKSEHEKALEKARQEARTEALTEAEKERRTDRLEVAVTRLAAKGVTLGEGDDAKVHRFADAEDALLHIQRGETDELFDDEGKVQTEPLEEALRDLIQRKPHLAAEGEKKPRGSADTRKGDPAQKDLEAMSPADHAAAKYGTAK